MPVSGGSLPFATRVMLIFAIAFVMDLVYVAAAAVHFTRAGALGAFVRAKVAALAGLPKALRKRRQVQRTRRVEAAQLRPLLVTGWLSTKLREKRFDAELAGLINSQQIKLDETRTGNRTFFEDFTWEHSLSSPQVLSINIAGSF